MRRLLLPVVALVALATGCQSVQMWAHITPPPDRKVLGAGGGVQLEYTVDVPAGIHVRVHNCDAYGAANVRVAADINGHLTSFQLVCDGGTGFLADVATLGPGEVSLLFSSNSSSFYPPDLIISVFAVGGHGEIIEVLA